jgi:hypothetical protein
MAGLVQACPGHPDDGIAALSIEIAGTSVQPGDMTDKPGDDVIG